MILNFPGGVCPQVRTLLGDNKIKHCVSCSAVCIAAADDAAVSIASGTAVMRGTLLGESGGVPVYSSVSGVFKGLATLEDKRYFVVMGNGGEDTEQTLSPETRPISELGFEDVLESARKFAIIDARSGKPLYELLKKIDGKCRRVVIDCTESDPNSAINYRLCLEYAREIVAGAKILLNSVGALKCVFTAEYYRDGAFDALTEYASDERLFAMAPMEEKYPYGDRALMYGLYVKALKEGETALDHGVLIVGAEAALSLYRAMATGMPQLDRFISVCGDGMRQGENLCVPRGMTVREVVGLTGGLKDGVRLVENSLLSGDPATGALNDGVMALIAVKPHKTVRTGCISCGLCASVCPVKLYPSDILTGSKKYLSRYCVSCGACEYICPGGIPLLRLIKHSDKED